MTNQVKNELIEFNPDFPVNYAPAQIDFKSFEKFKWIKSTLKPKNTV